MCGAWRARSPDRMIEVLKQKHGLIAMTLLRLVPLAPFAVESIVAGAIRMKLWASWWSAPRSACCPAPSPPRVFGDAIETGDHRQRPGELVAGRQRARPAGGRGLGSEALVHAHGARIVEHGEAGHQPR